MNILAAILLSFINVLDSTDIELFERIADWLMNLINPVESEKFYDYWYNALPNDDHAWIDTLIRVQFTELWFDIKDTDLVFTKL